MSSGGHGFFLCMSFFILWCLWKNGSGSSSGGCGIGGPYEGVGGVGVGVGGPYEGVGCGRGCGGGGGGPIMKCFFFFLHKHATGEKTVPSATER